MSPSTEPQAGGALEALRAADRDRYLTVLYAPAERREALAALYAFDAEIAAVRERIREPLPGEIRLQWWRDAILAGAPTGNPLADALNAAIARHALPRAAFDAYLEARIFDLYDDPMPSRGDLEGYCGETAGAILQMAALALDAPAAAASAALAGHAACAQAIAGLLTRLPRQRARGQCYLPRDMLAAAATSPEEFVGGQDPAGAQRAVAAMIALGREHLRSFEAGAGALPVTLRPAYLPVALAAAALRRMTPQAVLEGRARLAAWRRHWLLLRRAARGWSG